MRDDRSDNLVFFKSGEIWRGYLQALRELDELRLLFVGEVFDRQKRLLRLRLIFLKFNGALLILLVVSATTMTAA